jgi:hypothetical protein
MALSDMCESCVAKGLRRSRNTIYGLGFLGLCVLNVGCLALTRERVMKPLAPADQILTHLDNGVQPYSTLLTVRDFNLEVGVDNGPPRWEMVSLFWVLPVPYSSGGEDQPFFVRVHFRPKSESVTFDPWEVYFLGLGTNLMHARPAAVWRGGKSLGTNAAGAFVVTTETDLSLKFAPWAQTFSELGGYRKASHQDRDAPFRLSFEGIRISGQSFPLPPLTFKPTGHTRPEFRLPY